MFTRIKRWFSPDRTPFPGARFKLWQGSDYQFYFHLQSANGEITCQSEGYQTHAAAVNGIASIKRDAATAPIVTDR